MPLTIHLNGSERTFEELEGETKIASLIEALGLRSDRVALEQNGEIVPRTAWNDTELRQDDRIELVHFVGGG